ncbi:MAG: prepilin-type N-terminal cleavage/methylation domain-containing protein [Planctomycetes bacterium]|nr:prepilin-type N-terminal cleavage/methylation domain-containing protein [Planctomycetota bacterium]
MEQAGPTHHAGERATHLHPIRQLRDRRHQHPRGGVRTGWHGVRVHPAPSQQGERRMKRQGFTVIELLIASVITSMVAAAVISTMKAVTGSMEQQDLAADALARAARAEARVADHVNRARLILLQDADEVALWLPTEPFTSSATNTSDYDAINANERDSHSYFCFHCNAPVHATFFTAEW